MYSQAHTLRLAILFPITSLALAGAIVASNDGMGAEDLAAFGLWSLAWTPLVHGGLRGLQSITATLSPILSHIAAILLALAIVVVSIAIASLVLRDWIRVFSFPIGTIWLIASLLPTVMQTHLQRGGSVRLAASSVLLPAALAVGLPSLVPAEQPGDLVVVLKDGTTKDEADYFSDSVLNPPSTPTPATYNPYSTRSHVLMKENGRFVFRVFFHPGATRRDEFVAEIMASPQVAKVYSAPATPVENMAQYKGLGRLIKRPPNSALDPTKARSLR